MVINIDKINKKIINITSTNNRLISEAVNNLVQSGGKRLRPTMVILAARFGQNDPSKILEIAAGIEILHMATLVHDDIIDEAVLRRGEMTAQKQYGQKMAVFIGDYLLSSTYNVFEKHLSSNSRSKLNKIVRMICEGEINQFQNKYNYNITIFQYLKRIRRKTALLFGLSTYLGAYESEIRGQMLNNLYNVGLEMGMAFQIQDDILDFTGNKEVVGKKLGQDLISGVYTLPVIFLLHNEDYREKVIDIISDKHKLENDLDYLAEMINDSKVLEKSKKLGRKFNDRARLHLENLPQSTACDHLHEIIDNQLKRRY
jgi:heptaprenyl diphosphate synthase